jgi:outer membrane protein assembly factor BamB
VDGNPLLFFAGGNGIVYAFQTVPARKSDAPLFHLEKAWEFDCDPSAPKENVHLYNSNRREGPSNIFGMPVFHRGRLYFTSGGDLWWGKNEARLQCIDANGRGNVTSNALRWTYPLERHVLSTPAIEGDLLFVADCGRNVHCLDAGSGKSYWVHETKGEYWSSPLIADGKVFIGSRRGDFWVFAAAKEKKILHTTEFGRPISATATAANGVLYVATMDRLYALKEGVAAPNP